MKKINLDRRNIILISSYVFITAIFFTTGYFIGFKNNNKPILQETSSNVNSQAYDILTPAPTKYPSNYRVILEDGELRLYIDENGISRLISSESISEEQYPVSDIASLKKGITFETADGAISLMENFIS